MGKIVYDGLSHCFFRPATAEAGASRMARWPDVVRFGSGYAKIVVLFDKILLLNPVTCE
jgi:hypothetical protein